MNPRCQICGDHALIFNYGALSCLPCRTFFRRNALLSQRMRACRLNGQCSVNITTRKFCSSCRLAKCLAVGMCPDLIRKADLTTKKRDRNVLEYEEFIIVKIPKASALDQPPDGINLSLNTSDRIIISNVVHAFDAFSPTAEVRRTMEAVKMSPFSLQYSVPKVIQLMPFIHNSIQSFISSTPDFKILTLYEQRSLLQRNLAGLLCGSALFIVEESGFFDRTENELIFILVYGTKVADQLKSLVKKLTCDPVAIKLMLIVLAFSSSSYMLFDYGNLNQDSLLLGTFRLLGSQNAYVEILWKYLVHTYDFPHAVNIFAKMIKQLLDVFSLSIEISKTNEIHGSFFDNLARKAETVLTHNEKTSVALWGKQI